MVTEAAVRRKHISKSILFHLSFSIVLLLFSPVVGNARSHTFPSSKQLFLQGSPPTSSAMPYIQHSGICLTEYKNIIFNKRWKSKIIFCLQSDRHLHFV